MNSYIKLQNGLIINLSQIEICGPVLPYNLTYLGVLEIDDKKDIENGVFDIPNKLNDNKDNISINSLTTQIFCIPTDSPANEVYEHKIPESINYIPQQYMLLLKSGRIILLTKAEYDNICEVMDFNNNYSNIDYKYSKFS